jgi:transcriptional regulator with XRE-family HTH domain
LVIAPTGGGTNKTISKEGVMPRTTAFITPPAQARLGDLLTHYMEQLDVSVGALTLDMQDVYPAAESTILGWMANKPVTSPVHLRALISALQLPRNVVLDHVTPAALLPALWCRPVGDALKMARESRGVTVEEAGEKSGVSAGTIRRYEAATVAPRTKNLQALLFALNLAASDLLRFGDWPPAELPVGNRPAFATWLRSQRSTAGMSLAQFGELAGANFASVQSWEVGRSYPKKGTWTKLSETLTAAGYPITVEQLRAMQLPEWVSESELALRTPFAQLLARGRMSRRHSIDITAVSLGVTTAVYRSWEAGTDYPRTKDFAAVASALRGLGVNVNESVLRDMQPTEDTPAGESPLSLLLTNGRKAARLPLAEVADRCGAPLATYRLWDSGSTLPAATAWPVLMDILGLALEDTLEALQAHRFGGRRDQGTLIWALSTVRGLAPTQFAAELGVHRNMVSLWAEGRTAVAADRLPDVARTLNVTVERLMVASATPDTPYAEYGRKLAEARSRAGLSRSDVAKALDFHPGNLVGYESGATTPSSSVLARLEALYANAA